MISVKVGYELKRRLDMEFDHGRNVLFVSVAIAG